MRVARPLACLAAFGALLALPAASTGASGDRVLINGDRSGTARIYVVNDDGTGLKRLTDGSESVGLLNVSWDASRILFTEGSYPDFTYFTMDLSGASIAPLNLDPPGTYPSFSHGRPGLAFLGPDGQIYYSSGDDGAAARALTKTCHETFDSPCPETQWAPPGFSPNGRFLYADYQDKYGGGVRTFDLDALPRNVPGGHATRAFKQLQCCQFSTFLDFAPDSSAYLVIGSSPGGPTPKVILDQTGAGPVQLTPNGRWAGGAFFTPDGRVVLFDRPDKSSVQDSREFVVRADGSHRHRVRGGHLVRRGLFSAADLSYDGTRVLRVHYEMNSQQEVKSTTIYTTHVDGSRRVKIFKGRGDTSAEWVPTP